MMRSQLELSLYLSLCSSQIIIISNKKYSIKDADAFFHCPVLEEGVCQNVLFTWVEKFQWNIKENQKVKDMICFE